MAKRIQFRAHGGPEVLEFVDYEPAAPGPNQVRVANKAIGLNFIDTYFRSGLYAAARWAPTANCTSCLKPIW